MVESSLIYTIAISLSLAFVLGFLAFKLRLSPIVGYLVAGVCISPHTPGIVANPELASQLSDIGVVLLMFGIGLHFSTKDFLAVSRVALLGALPQTLLTATAAAFMASCWGWSLGSCLLLGASLSVASTIVVIGELEKRNLVEDVEGKTCVGWLLSQDLLAMLFLALLPALASILSAADWTPAQLATALPAVAMAVLKAATFICVMLFAGSRFFPWMLKRVADTGSRELFTLFVIGVPLGISLGAAQLFGVSLALGAFLAGMVLNESDLSDHAAAKALPLQDAFAVLFFVSTGMAFRPLILLTHTLQVLCSVLFVTIFTPLLALLLTTLLMRSTVRVSATVAASLAQVGEFSLVLATLGLRLGIVPEYVYATIVAVVLIAICLHSVAFSLLQALIFSVARRLQKADAKPEDTPN